MPNYPIRVAMIMGKMIGGGVEAVVMNYYRHIDKSKIQFDFIIDEDSILVPEEEIAKMGGRIYRVHPYQQIFSYMKDLSVIFNENTYEIVHSHINSLSVIPLKVAKKCGIPIRIAHNHSTAAPGEFKKNIIKYILRVFSNLYPTHYMSPTRYAGEWLFGEKVAQKKLFVVKNAIELDRFIYNEKIRTDLRQQLGYSEKNFVIGNIGRMVWQKNQKFVIDIFTEFRKSHLNAKLLIIGDGPLKEELIRHAKKKKVLDVVKFLPNNPNVQDYYQVIDFFLFPSNYEGLGMVAIEAQVSGLPIIGSTMVPEDVNVSELYDKVSLVEDATVWSRHIVLPSKKRFNHINEVANAGYDINQAAYFLEEIYLSFFGSDLSN